MNQKVWIARNLAAAFLSAAWTPDALTAAALPALGVASPPRWLVALSVEVVAASTTAYPPSPRRLTAMIMAAKAFGGLRLAGRKRPVIQQIVTVPPIFAPAVRFRDLDVPRLATPGALADWLDLPMSKLDWLADVEEYRAAATPHYDRHWVAKQAGPPRLIEAPKAILKSIQRRILREILDPVAVHDSVHGYRKGRSCITAAHRHAGEHVVLALDLANFFPRIPAARIHGLYRSLGYPWAVARQLTGLCTAATPGRLFHELSDDRRHDWSTRNHFSHPHLPQGAPTSPALANLCAWRMDRRLTGLARRMNARYTRYADDLAFSGDQDFSNQINWFSNKVIHICENEGFSVNARKTRVMRASGCQRLTGLVINQHVNVSRGQYDRLKAILHNCARHGPASQNRDRHPAFRAHLDGKITWIENVNPAKGHHLRRVFQSIAWS